METMILQEELKQQLERPAVTSLQETAETILMDALQHARTRFVHPISATGLEGLLMRHDFVDYLKFGLAERIARTLAAHDALVQSVHYFDPDLGADAETETYTRIDPSVNLLVHVESKTAALNAFIAALDGALTAQARKLPAPYYAALDSILNAILITGDDVAQGRGYAVLLSSRYLQPRQVW